MRRVVGLGPQRAGWTQSAVLLLGLVSGANVVLDLIWVEVGEGGILPWPAGPPARRILVLLGFVLPSTAAAGLLWLEGRLQIDRRQVAAASLRWALTSLLRRHMLVTVLLVWFAVFVPQPGRFGLAFFGLSLAAPWIWSYMGVLSPAVARRPEPRADLMPRPVLRRFTAAVCLLGFLLSGPMSFRLVEGLGAVVGQRSDAAWALHWIGYEVSLVLFLAVSLSGVAVALGLRPIRSELGAWRQRVCVGLALAMRIQVMSFGWLLAVLLVQRSLATFGLESQHPLSELRWMFRNAVARYWPLLMTACGLYLYPFVAVRGAWLLSEQLPDNSSPRKSETVPETPRGSVLPESATPTRGVLE